MDPHKTPSIERHVFWTGSEYSTVFPHHVHIIKEPHASISRLCDDIAAWQPRAREKWIENSSHSTVSTVLALDFVLASRLSHDFEILFATRAQSDANAER